MKGMFVQETRAGYASAIVSGRKPIETRGKAMLSALVGERVAVVRTGGKVPMVVGYVTVTRQDRAGVFWLDAHRDLTLIPKGSRFDNYGAKWCYWLDDPEECNPYPLPADAVRHGRSWCEF